jgi:ribosomal protein S18 acetylase RimI-like enzyme
MAALAALIEEGFSENLDRPGREMVESMRSLGRMGWLGWLIARLTLPPAAYPMGFVWEQDGEVVGNASLMPVVGFPQRWVMANVAVKPSHRGQGIARELVEASIDLARRRRGHQIVLQVDESNQIATKMYIERHFSPLTTRTTWELRGVGTEGASRIDSSPMVRKRRPHEWDEQWHLAQRLHPEGLIWPFPLFESFFRAPGLAGRVGNRSDRDWIWHESGRMRASLSARWSFEIDRWRLILMVEPEARGGVERHLLTACLLDIGPTAKPLFLEYEHGPGEESIRELGFQPRRTLTWMGLDFTDQASW